MLPSLFTIIGNSTSVWELPICSSELAVADIPCTAFTLTVRSCVAYAPPPLVGKTENVSTTSSVANASLGKEIVTSIVPDFSLLCLEPVVIVDDSNDTAQPVGGDVDETLKVSCPLP